MKRICGKPKADEQPCGYRLSGDRECPWHGESATPESKSLHALRGGLKARLMRALPANQVAPEFSDPESIIKFAQELGRLALTADVDMRRLAEARGAATLALTAHSAQTQARLVDALLRLEHGGGAVALLASFQAAQGDPTKRRPLPPRIITALPTSGTEPV